MANLVEVESFDEGVYRIETTDQVLGGELGTSNKPLKNLANRTNWLKAAVMTINSVLAGLKSASTKVANAVKTLGDVPLWDNVYDIAEVDAMLAADPIDNHQQVTGVSLITGSGAEANMSDMSVTFNPKGKKIFVMFSAPFHTSTGSQTFTVYINIGGTNVMSQTVNQFSNDQVIALQTIATVTPGASITAKIRWNAVNTITQAGATSPRVLTILDLP